MALRKVIYNGDCVELLSSQKAPTFLLEEVFTKETELEHFEQQISVVSKAVYLGQEPLSDQESQIA